MPVQRTLLILVAYVVAYIALDWVSYIHPLGPFAITPWNPPPGLSIALLLTLGLRFAPALFVAGFAAEAVVRGLPAGALVAAGSSAVIAAGYTAAAWALRGPARIDPLLRGMRDVARLVGVTAVATLAVGAGYVAIYFAAGRIPVDALARSALQFWVGDALGVLITAPVLLAVLEARRAAPTIRWSWEAAAQAAAVACALWVVFGIEPAHAERFFYMLFLPLIWISVRHGIRGATWALLAMQLGIVAAVQVQGLASATLLELQVFMVALAITGLFLGAVVTERRHAGEALEAREAELQRSLRLAAAAETASALAHELNQPLSAIATYVRACAILAERPEENRTRLVETMGTVTTEVARAGDVVRRLREFFRSGASRLEHASVVRLLASAAERAAPRLERHRIALTVECDPALPGVLVDRLQIETVLHNLLANAIDAIAAGDPPARAIVLRAVRDARDAVRITVRDSGPGLPGGMPPGAFPPFATTKSDGMGLGLAISRSIVESHGGRLAADPAERGASFSFTLPAEETAELQP
jgi:two-component system, LuxR family, sensor kinase FixL